VTFRRTVLASLLVLVALVSAEAVRALFPVARAGDPIQTPGKYLGASTCSGASCHEKPDKPRDTPPGLQEYTTWSTPNSDGSPADRHSYAFKRLKPKAKGGDDRSPEIMKKLNEIEKTSETAETSERCLTCHGVAVHDYGVGKSNPGAAVGKHKELQGGKFRPEDGVSCDGCHGPAEKWLKLHDKKNWTIAEWQKQGGKSGGSQKLYDAFGIYFSKDLELWANQCVRCHLRIDTNLIDAGHPDLNAFELFYQNQFVPPHWRDYTTAAPSPELPAAGPMHAAVVWQTGQAVALRASLEQVRVRKDAKPEHLAAAIERATAHWVTLRHALARFAPDAAKPLDEAMSDLKGSGDAAAKAAEKALEVLKPVARAAADAKCDLASVTDVMKGIANDPQILESQRFAEQATKALYSLGYARLAQTKPDDLLANPPADPVMKAVYAMLEAIDPKADTFKKSLGEIKAALK